MFLTNVLLKKVKSKSILVQVESIVSGHRRNLIRERLADKMEIVMFDPMVQMKSIYREVKKVCSIK